MTVQEFFDGLTSGATWSAGVAFKRSNPLPIDRYSVFNAYTPEGPAPDVDDGSLNYYIESNPVAYPGQVVAVIAEGSATVYVLQGEAGGTLTPVALASSETTADIAELEGKVGALETWKGQVETWQNTVLVDGDVESKLSGNTTKIPNSKAVKDVTDALDTRLDAVEGAAGNYVLKSDIDTASLSDSDAKVPSSKLVKTTTDGLDTRLDAVESTVSGLGTTYEVLNNKSQSITTDTGNTAKYPSVKAVEDYVDTAVGSVDVEKTLEEVLTAGATAADKNVTLTGSSSLSIGTPGGTSLIKLNSGLGTISIEGVSGGGGSTFSLSNTEVSGGDALKESFKTWLEVNNVTNESKETMFTDPTFTGTVTVTETPVNDTDAANKKYVDDAITAIPPVETPTLAKVLAAGNTASTGINLENGHLHFKIDLTRNTSGFSLGYGDNVVDFGVSVTDTDVSVTLSDGAKTEFQTKLGIQDMIDASIEEIPPVEIPTLAQVVAKGNVITGTEATDKTTLSAGVVSLENATNNFKVDVVSGTVTGSDGIKDAFVNWLGVGQVYRYETA